MDVIFDEEYNQIKFIIPDDGPNGSSPKFEVEADVLQKYVDEEGKEQF